LRLIFWLIDEERLSAMDLWGKKLLPKGWALARLRKILRILIYSLFWNAAYITTPDFSLKKMVEDETG
jgi:hypothetical protein